MGAASLCVFVSAKGADLVFKVHREKPLDPVFRISDRPAFLNGSAGNETGTPMNAEVCFGQPIALIDME
ncbi:MAG: hypothetical protein WAM67_09090 [Candidatus Acidiferrales bacterium]